VTTRAERASNTREQLIEAGFRLAEHTGLAGMSVNQVVAEAGVAKGTFFHHFGDRSAYLVALHRDFHDRLFTQVREDVATLPPGRDRLLTSANAYLDACLRQRGARALLFEARADPAIPEAIAARNAAVAQEQSADFAVLGWDDPRSGAALWNGLVTEAVLIEFAARSRLTAIRDALARFLPAGHDAVG
jgi:AcrR family transcriptional regulator